MPAAPHRMRVRVLPLYAQAMQARMAEWQAQQAGAE
jgi:hypothetical protein